MKKNDKREGSFVVGLEEGFKLQYSLSFNNCGGKSSSRKRPPLTSTIDDNGSVPWGLLKVPRRWIIFRQLILCQLWYDWDYDINKKFKGLLVHFNKSVYCMI